VDEVRSAQTLLNKLRSFVEALDPDERELFAALIGPGIARALDGDDVEGFALGGQESDRLARGLVEAYRAREANDGDGWTS
jgi:hypothetical protein